MEAMDLIPVADSESKDILVDSIMKGDLVINEEGEAVYTPQHKRSTFKDAITFRERSGNDLQAMGKKTKGENSVTALYAGMASNTGQAPVIFNNLVGRDIKTCEAIFGLLMA